MEGLKENKDVEKENSSKKKQPEKQKKSVKEMEALPGGLRALQNKYCSDLLWQFFLHLTQIPCFPSSKCIECINN